MGLDLFHVLPCRLEKNKNSGSIAGYFELTELKDYPEFIEKNKEFITETNYPLSEFKIIIIENESQKEEMQKYYSQSPILIGKIHELENEIKTLEATHQLIHFPKNISIINDYPDSTDRYHEIEYETNSTQIEIMYYRQLGYQRKGMNGDFYTYVKNCKLYINLHTVINIHSCIQSRSDNEDIHQLKKSFKENFIDNFIEGKSIFFATW